MLKRFSIALFASALVATAAEAAGNLATKPTRLEVAINKDLQFSKKEFQLETGKYYRLTVDSKAGDEVMFVSPDLFRNAWISQIVIAGIEVHPMGGIEGIEFDEDGKVDIYFVPIRTGDFTFGLKGHEARGAVGKFVVR